MSDWPLLSLLLLLYPAGALLLWLSLRGVDLPRLWDALLHADYFVAREVMPSTQQGGIQHAEVESWQDCCCCCWQLLQILFLILLRGSLRR